VRALLALALVLPLLAGCFGAGGDDPAVPTGPPLTADAIRVPSGAVLETIEGGFAAVWDDVALPMTASVILPEGATMVRAVTTEGGSSVFLSNTETGRRRCNNPSVESFSDSFGYPRSCSGITAIDEPGTEWTASFGAPSVGGGLPVNTGSAPSQATGDVRVEFLSTPLDGLAGLLDLDLITPPIHSLRPVEVLFIESFGGVLLRLEVHRPEGDGPWPVILESSPYHDDGVRAAPASFAYFANDWARRGYAVVVADVRGFGDSGGCVEVWGPNEQADQKVLVEWAASQPWSDGNVGFYGQSYVGTTPVEAAVQAPPALKAIIAVAPVIHSYDDWHFGGVPNGESRLSPVAYQVLTEGTVTGAPGMLGEGNVRDPLQVLNNLGNGLCDPTLVARANDPRALDGTQFYNERNFKARAGDVTAAVLYTQGFEDANVKGAMIPGWFNELTSPKLGLFGHFLHQHPPRMDTEALMVGWMEQYLKGKPIGFETLPAAAIQVNRETHRTASEWPPSTPTTTSLWPHLLLQDRQLGDEPAEGTLFLHLDPTGAAGPGKDDAFPAAPFEVSYTGRLSNATSLAGSATLHIRGAMQGFGTAYLMAELWVDGSLVTWGQVNLAHSAEHTSYAPLVLGQVVERDMPFRPTERVLPAGAEVVLVLRGVAVADATDPSGATAAGFSFFGGLDGTRLDLPGVPLSEYQPIPLTARP
jgi:alpha-beta hydrolase superfamily lysophospholipase